MCNICNSYTHAHMYVYVYVCVFIFFFHTAAVCFDETNSTFKFASRAKKISNKILKSADSEGVLMKKYKDQIDDLKVGIVIVPKEVVLLWLVLCAFLY